MPDTQSEWQELEDTDDWPADGPGPAIYVYSGPIVETHARVLRSAIAEEPPEVRSILLFLTTFGGSADAAYTISRMLQDRFDRFVLYAAGPCKSAGTLVSLGATEIVMSAHGELGPLDVQARKEDDLMRIGSGLDVVRAIEALRECAWDIFEEHFLEIIKRSGGLVTFRTAAELATSMAVGLLSPISGSIDPLKLGEMRRALDIATEYGQRLGQPKETVRRLVHGYPSHGFVIDFKEAQDLPLRAQTDRCRARNRAWTASGVQGKVPARSVD